MSIKMPTNTMHIHEVVYSPDTPETFIETVPAGHTRLPVKVRFTMNNGRGNYKRLVRRIAGSGVLYVWYAGAQHVITGEWAIAVERIDAAHNAAMGMAAKMQNRT